MNVNTRPTMQMVLSKIDTVIYVRMPSGTAIVCEIRLTNRHVVHGIAVVVDMENDDEVLGKKTAYDNAIHKIFDIVAYEMHDKMVDLNGHGPEIENTNRELQAKHFQAVNGHPVLI